MHRAAMNSTSLAKSMVQLDGNSRNCTSLQSSNPSLCCNRLSRAAPYNRGEAGLCAAAPDIGSQADFPSHAEKFEPKNTAQIGWLISNSIDYSNSI